MKLHTVALLLLAALAAAARDRLPARRRLSAQQACGQLSTTCCCQPVFGKSCRGTPGEAAAATAVADAARQLRVTQARLPPPLAGVPSYQTCCRSADLFCQMFSFVEPGIPGACPQPSLCLPVPEVRGCLPHFLCWMAALACPDSLTQLSCCPTRPPQGCGKAEGSPCCPPPSAGAGDFSCGGGLKCEGAAGVDPSYRSFLRLQSEGVLPLVVEVGTPLA